MTAASESVGWGSMEKDIFAGEYPIKLGGVTYKKGLHTHAPAKITYSLNGRYSRFESYVGLWDSGNPKRGKKNDPAGTKGSIVVQVFLDGVKKYDSGLLGWRDTRHIQLSVIGARTMDLVVTDGGDGAGWDWAVWGNPKLYK
jgi:endo-alpha-N-acetylgalactosaminidase